MNTNKVLLFILMHIKLRFMYHLTHLDTNDLHQKLDQEEENALCCFRNKKCCKKRTGGPTFEVRAFLKDCPSSRCNNDTSLQTVMKNRGNDELTGCIQKLFLTVKIINFGVSPKNIHYIVIDHITDPDTDEKIRILNPYVIRLRQEPLVQIYDLNFERMVNAEAKEIIHNKHNQPNYQGCNLGPENPTCRIIKHEGRSIPYSSGFCCSCDPEKNLKMQPDSTGDPAFSIRHPAKQFDLDTIPQHEQVDNEEAVKSADIRGNKEADLKLNYLQYNSLASQGNENNDKIIFKRTARKRTNVQTRGGQDCSNLEIQPESFHESAHCLGFSNLWYSVYGLNKPRIEHKMYIQIFQKYDDSHGNTRWKDLTKSKILLLGDSNPSCFEDLPNVLVKYTAEDTDNCGSFSLNYKMQKLLIPERKVFSPEEFMVVPKKMVSLDGRTCNKIGVGYEGFYKQSKRCLMSKGSCLGNQPKHFYMSDKRAELEGRPGHYFLKFYGLLPDNSVERNSSGHEKIIQLLYLKRHISNLHFEIRADHVGILQPNSMATITEVYTDSTGRKNIKIFIKITNSGLIYGIFYVRLGNCPFDIPSSFNNIASKSVLIGPQRQHIFNIFIEFPLPMSDFYCSVYVHNPNQEIIAIRQIRFRNTDRCICVWHCKCVCYVADGSLRCEPITPQSYQAAGFQGGLPTPSRIMESSYLDELLAKFVHMFIILAVTLLIMGFIKALLGLCIKNIGMWGLYLILGIEETDIECLNENCPFRENQISSIAQFCLNILFFFIYPLALLNACVMSYCFSNYSEEYNECECEDVPVYEIIECPTTEACRLRNKSVSSEKGFDNGESITDTNTTTDTRLSESNVAL